MGEDSKNAKFVRLAESRTRRVVENLRMIGNLSSKTNYEYSEPEVNIIFSFIEDRVKEAKSRFNVDQTTPPKLDIKLALDLDREE